VSDDDELHVVKAMFDYAPAVDGQISLEAGEVIH
jgi:hypothetical protein